LVDENSKVEFSAQDGLIEIRYFDTPDDERCRSWKMPKTVAEEVIAWRKKFNKSERKKFPVKEKTRICEFNMATDKYINIREFDSMGGYKMTGWSWPIVVMEKLIDWSRDK